MTRATIFRLLVGLCFGLRGLPCLLALAACEERHTVTLLLGPNDTTLTAGFTCRDDTGTLLVEQTRRGAAYSFQLVFDTVGLGATFPGCRGEELFAACTGHACGRIGRYCVTVSIAQGDFGSPAAILASLHAQIGHPQLIADAPRDPVVVRAVATQQSCTELLPADGTYPRLDADQVVGCAYSCPVVLDDLRGSLGMALDTLDDQCASQVRACAKFGP
jgi:hypothetical protein